MAGRSPTLRRSRPLEMLVAEVSAGTVRWLMMAIASEEGTAKVARAGEMKENWDGEPTWASLFKPN